MKTAHKTLAAVDAAVQAAQEPPFRAHLGASVIGGECARATYYSFRWVGYEKFSGRMLRLFERGQLEEKRIVGFLRAAGMEIWEIDTHTGKQFRIEDCQGHFGGSLDGVGTGCPDLPKDTPFLCEFKTHGDSSFKKLKDQGLIKSKWQHFVQMQCYMGKMELNYALYCAVNKNDDEFFMELVNFDKNVYLEAIQKASSIIFASEPPRRISESPAWFTCKYCTFQGICQLGKGGIERNCRTCVYGHPAPDGLWQCHYDKHLLDEAAQRAGCEHYEVNPQLTKP